MKKVDEGVELFDEIWEKVYSAEQQNQKEKYEMDLKKEIKKLQRLRDQIKTWIGSSDVKDKDHLLDARRLIETKMEKFKICEKDTKTKAYSKEGLARQAKLDPHEQAKKDTTDWISEIIEQLTKLVEDREVEVERLGSGKGKKTNKHIIEEYNHFINNHKFHVNKLEGIMRLVNNDVLDVEVVNPVKEDLDYYLESYEDDDYQQAYDEEFFYEALNLEEIGVVNVDRVTNVDTKPTKKSKDDDNGSSSSSKGSKEKKSSKKSSVSSVIPLTIGRARKSSKSKDKEDKDEESTPSKRSSSNGPTPTTIPAARPAAPQGGASMAAILKRETEQQEKERQKARQAEQLRQQQAAQQLQRQQQEAQLRQQQEALRQQQQRQEAAAKQKAMQQQEVLRQQQAQQEALKRQQQAAQQQVLQQQQVQSTPEKSAVGNAQGGQGIGVAGLDMLTSGLGGLNLSAAGAENVAPDGSYSSALNDSFATMPGSADNERTRPYTPQNPYPTPASYPAQPSPIFENPAVFEKLGTDALFFIFYYAQGTYQQYLAARELKKQSWRFHKKYMTWFQRHEEPKVTTDEYEQGTYVYFDYETGWCTRIKQDFRFEYSFLEDSLQ